MAVAVQNTQDLPQSSLYVGDLHPLATEAMLYTKFAEIGPVLSTRVCRDLATRSSLGYGYVNFEDPKDAEKAIENLNYELFMGRPIRIMWSQRDPSLRKSGRGNIFIKNLEKSINQKELYDTFSFFGKILSCKIAMDDNGNSKGYGFVHFEKEESAEDAIKKINEKLIRNRMVYVGKFIPRSDRKSASGKLTFNNIYVKNFSLDLTDEQLRELFAEFGEIKSCCVQKNSEGTSKGFGFVCFANPEHAEQAVKVMHGKEIGGRPLYVNRAQRKEERQEELKQRLEKQRAERQSKYVPGVNLYVKNLDDSIDDERLKEAFCQYGPITSAKVMTDSTGRSKGFGFVCFTQPEQAARAVTEMNATLLGSKPLYVALAQRKEDRRARLMAEHQQRLTQYKNNVTPMLPAAAAHAPGYFPPTAFPQAQRFYHPSNAILGSQPRWNRPAGMTGGMPAQLGGPVPARPPMPGHYIGAPNPAAGMTANQMAAMAQMRSTAGVGRPILQSGMPGLPTGPHLTGSAMMNPAAAAAAAAAQRQSTGRPQVPLQQVMSAPSAGLQQRPSMASVVAAPPNVHPNAMNQVQRGVMQQGMGQVAGAAGNVRFNQTARNVTAQPAPAPTMSNVLAPVGDQGTLTISALAQLPEEEQKRLLGERLFPLVQEIYPSLAQKLTGMLLGVDNAEVIHLLESKDSLRAKLEEGISVLRNSRNLATDGGESNVAHTDPVTGNATQPGQNGDGSNGMSDTAGPTDMKSQAVAGDGMKADN